MQNNRFPVVSVPSGSASAKKYIKRELEWLSKFENIVLMFDNDSHHFLPQHSLLLYQYLAPDKDCQSLDMKCWYDK